MHQDQNGTNIVVLFMTFFTLHSDIKLNYIIVIDEPFPGHINTLGLPNANNVKAWVNNGQWHDYLNAIYTHITYYSKF